MVMRRRGHGTRIYVSDTRSRPQPTALIKSAAACLGTSTQPGAVDLALVANGGLAHEVRLQLVREMWPAEKVALSTGRRSPPGIPRFPGKERHSRVL